jgi:hypothetical protein
MANILPQDAQKKVWGMYRSRMVFVLAIGLFALALAGSLTLVPSYIALKIGGPPVSDVRAAEEERADAIALERADAVLRELAPFAVAATSSFSGVEAALAARPAGIKIGRIIYQAGEEEGQVTLIGSGARDAVSAYKDALTKSGAFSSVSVPVGALVSAEAGGFTMLLTGDF